MAIFFGARKDGLPLKMGVLMGPVRSQFEVLKEGKAPLGWRLCGTLPVRPLAFR
jgi:hypothetical protein